MLEVCFWNTKCQDLSRALLQVYKRTLRTRFLAGCSCVAVAEAWWRSSSLQIVCNSLICYSEWVEVLANRRRTQLGNTKMCSWIRVVAPAMDTWLPHAPKYVLKEVEKEPQSEPRISNDRQGRWIGLFRIKLRQIIGLVGFRYNKRILLIQGL